MPSFRSKLWDGKIRLYSTYDRKLYGGLLSHVAKFAVSRKYDIVSEHDFENEPDSNKPPTATSVPKTSSKISPQPQ